DHQDANLRTFGPTPFLHAQCVSHSSALTARGNHSQEANIRRTSTESRTNELVEYLWNRHELYTHQYRAMFVEHCRTIETEALRFTKETKRGKQAKASESSIPSSE